MLYRGRQPLARCGRDIRQVRRFPRPSAGTLEPVAAKPHTGMVGRVAEREAFERWLHEVRQGRSAGALIEGEAGIGKTTLADVVCASAAGVLFRGSPRRRR